MAIEFTGGLFCVCLTLCFLGCCFAAALQSLGVHLGNGMRALARSNRPKQIETTNPGEDDGKH